MFGKTNIKATALCAIVLVGVGAISLKSSAAAALPGPADAGRIEQREDLFPAEPMVLPPSPPMQVLPTLKVPEQSKHVTLTLSEVDVTGMTAFTNEEIKDIYTPLIGHEVTLDTIWMMAGQLTERYRNAGYFLTRVTVPQQEIKDGVINLKVIEGYIGEIKLDDELASNWIVKQWIDKLQSYRPIKAAQIESVLLELNDLPGVNLHAVLEPIQSTDNAQGAVRLVLEPKPQPYVSGSISFDNNGSRYLGPYEAEAQAQAVLIPTERTTISFLSSLPWHELKYGSLKQEIPLFAAATFELYGTYTHALPGSTLKDLDIVSDSGSAGAAFDYSIIRQRQQNLSTRIAFEGQNSHSDILGTTLTDDAVRAVRASLLYQIYDELNGQNSVNGAVAHGLDVFGASHAGQENISRAEATPNFTKFNLDISRLQTINEEWTVFGAASGQLASGPLYSSEQFGYGGQAFGRSYDNSEITGDQGIDASVELRYSGFRQFYQVQAVPYGFYDIGDVWNLGKDPTVAYTSGSSTGIGFRIMSDINLSSNFGVAFPLTRKIANPIYGNGKSPRYFIQLSYGF